MLTIFDDNVLPLKMSVWITSFRLAPVNLHIKETHLTCLRSSLSVRCSSLLKVTALQGKGGWVGIIWPRIGTELLSENEEHFRTFLS